MKATAYIVGPREGSGAALQDLAYQLDFGLVLPFGGVAQAEQQANLTPLCFFLFAAVDDVGTLRSVAEAIRFSTTRRIRFSPLIYFSENPQIDTITRCINMGFDDVITMPFTATRIAERIERQVGQTVVYYETPSYFGPDRRDRVPISPHDSDSRNGGQFRRIEIVRHAASGIQVVRDSPYLAI